MNIAEEEAQELLKTHTVSKDGQLKGNPAVALSSLPPEKFRKLRRELGIKGNKYGAVRTWSNYSKRHFDSKAEARRADELYLMEKAGEISGLEYQTKWVLCEKPRITYSADFRYIEKIPGEYNNRLVFEDVKGVLTRDTRTKIAWVKEKFGAEVRLVK